MADGDFSWALRESESSLSVRASVASIPTQS